MRPIATTLRFWVALSLVVITALGFACKDYTGPWQGWVSDHLSGVPYEIFWCLALFLIWPRRAAINRIALGVFVVTCALETLQLWHPRFLQAIRGTFVGGAILGTTFKWDDFPYYALGSVLGWLWLRGLSRAAHTVASGASEG